MTKIEIIDETVAYYQTHNRSVLSDYSCEYNGPNGEKCAFSRCCTADSVFEENESSIMQKAAVLLPQYAHIPYHDSFWMDLQSLHDNADCWDGRSLTGKGIERIAILKKRYA